MMYQIVLARSARKEFLHLPDDVSDRITRKLRELQDTPRPVGMKKLAGREGFRVRVGDYRILYQIEDEAQTVTIVRVRHRREVYH